VLFLFKKDGQQLNSYTNNLLILLKHENGFQHFHIASKKIKKPTVIRQVLLGVLYFYILCFILVVIIILKAPEFIELEDGTLVPVEKEPVKS
jgi:hypothetical protein